MASPVRVATLATFLTSLFAPTRATNGAYAPEEGRPTTAGNLANYLVTATSRDVDRFPYVESSLMGDVCAAANEEAGANFRCLASWPSGVLGTVDEGAPPGPAGTHAARVLALVERTVNRTRVVPPHAYDWWVARDHELLS